MYIADVNGDGRTDLYCGRDFQLSIAVALGNGGFAAPILASTEFPVANGTFGNANFNFVDVTGDRRAELLDVTLSAGSGFVLRSASPLANNTYPLSRNGGAVFPANGQSAIPMNATDVDGDGLADLVAFSDVAYVARSFGNGVFDFYRPAVNNFGLTSGWSFNNHVRVVQDITGDRRSDIVGFGNAGIFTATSLGNGTFGGTQFAFADFGFDQGWRLAQNPRFVTDITGDARADIVGFGNIGVFTAVAQGDGTFA